MRGLSGKVVVVTGGSKGIGAATSRRLAEEGAKVAITDVDSEAGEALARSLGDSLEDTEGSVGFWHLDVSDEEEVRRVFDEVVERFGSLDILVNNAGISGPDQPTHTIATEDWSKVLAVNVNGVFFATKHAIPHMKRAGGGSIINLSSIYGIVGAPDIPPYHASKGAVREMTKVDALLYAEDGIRVNSVHPGFIWTPLVEDLAERSGKGVTAFRRELDALHPIGHVGEPEDVAAGIAYLSSDEAKFVTGAELVIDGGYICR